MILTLKFLAGLLLATMVIGIIQLGTAGEVSKNPDKKIVRKV